MMILDNAFADCQAYTRSRKIIFSMKPLEKIKDPVGIRLLETYTIIFKQDMVVMFVLLRTFYHRTLNNFGTDTNHGCYIFPAVFYRITNKVLHYLQKLEW